MHLETWSMTNPEGESNSQPLRLAFDRRLKLEFHGSRITSDAGLLAYRELDDALGLTGVVGDELVDPRTGKNGQHAMKGLFRQSVFGRLGGYEDVNDADRLGRDPAMRWIVGGRAVAKAAASTSQMGRFETEFLATDENLTALAGLSGQWIDRVHEPRPVCHFPTGGGCGAEGAVPKNPPPHRWAATGPFAAMTAAHPVASRSPDRLGVCCPGQSAPSQCGMVTGPSFSSPIHPDQVRPQPIMTAQGRIRGRMPILLSLSAVGRSHLGYPGQGIWRRGATLRG
jgi:hypothetical protein